MGKLKQKLGRRILAYVLSGAMILSGVTSPGMTAFASEVPHDTGGIDGYNLQDVKAGSEGDDVSGSETKKWDFREYAKTHTDAVEQQTQITEWDELTTNGGKYHGTSYGLTIGKGTISVPVSGNSKVSVLAGYTWDISIGNKNYSYKRASNGTDETFVYPYVGEGGTVTITANGNVSSYIKMITVEPAAANEYAIQIAEADYGTASASAVFAEQGANVTLTAAPDQGYKLTDWEKSDSELEIESDASDSNKATFTMPANNVEITPVFAEDADATYSIQTLDGYHGTAKIKDGKGTDIAPDTEVVLADVAEATADTGYTFKEWYVTKLNDTVAEEVTVTDGKFTMPSGDVQIIPIFTGSAKGTYIFKNAKKTDRAKGSQIEDFTGIITFDGLEDANNDHGFVTNKENATMTLKLSGAAEVAVDTCKWNSACGGVTATLDGTACAAATEVANASDGKTYTVTTDKGGELVLTLATKNNYVHGITVEYSGGTGETLDFGGKYFKDVTFTGADFAGKGLVKDDSISKASLDGLLLDKDDSLTYFDNLHGALTNSNGATLNLNLEKKANIEILGCRFGKSTNITAKSTKDGTTKTLKVAKGEGAAEGDTIPPLYTILDAEGVVSVKFTQQEYIHSIKVIPLTGAATQYLVEVTNDGHGTTAVEGNPYAEAGKTVTLTAKANSSYRFKEWGEKSPADLAITQDGDDKYKFTMPASDVKAKAIFEATETIYVAEGTHNFGGVTSLVVDGFEFTGFTTDGNKHGFAFSDEAEMKLSLREKANVTVYGCCYGAGTELTMEASSGKVSVTSEEEESGKDRNKFTVTGAKGGELVLKFNKASWISTVMVEYPGEVEPGVRDIDVWDFSGFAMQNQTPLIYNNKITPDDLKIIVGSDGKFISVDKKKEAVFGDLTMVYEPGDRLYTNVAGLPNAGDYGNAQYEYDDFTAAGAWYSNGTGGSGRRYVTVKMQTGDKLVAYMGSSQSGDINFTFEGTGGADGQKDSISIESGKFGKFVFVAEKTGTYKLWADGAGKPMYHRIMRVPALKVKGTIDYNNLKDKVSGAVLKFKNMETKAETEAELSEDGSFSAILAPGFQYRAVLSGAMGYGFDTATKYIETKDEEYKTGKSNVKLKVVETPVYPYSGEITGFAEGYDTSRLAITMLADEDSDAEDVDVTIEQKDGKISFTTTLMPEVKYTFALEGVNDYEINDPLEICNEDNSDYTGKTIKVALKALYDVKGAWIGLGDSAKVTALKFTNVEDAYPYVATVNEDGKGYTAKLRDGAYLAEATVNGFRTKTHVVVEGKAVEKDLMFVSTGEKAKIDYVADIYVGYPDKENNYETMRAAMEACDLMKPATEGDGRVTVHIAPGTYREQVIVNRPNVSFVNDTDKEVLLTWYYGIGYKYYSSNNGYYDPENAYDQFDKHIADRWGVAVRITTGATGFRAKGITFENSFNRYITDEELEDGVECTGETLKIERKRNTDVNSKAATERAAAIAVEGDKAEFVNCSFYSSQDTVYTGEVKAYFKNCVLEGQTDYIFGDTSTAVFDACELSWKGYSANSQGGYVTAHRGNGAKGYLFRNCTVTANNHNYEGKALTVTPGYFGRPWGADASVVFLNTKLQNADLIEAVGWTEMSGNDPKKANFYEYNTTTIAGTAVDTSKRAGNVMAQDAASKVTVADYFGDWKPSCYVEEEATVEFKEALRVVDNGDINAPYPGHTLTAMYSLGDANDANDASVIQWYIVDKDGKEELRKESTAAVDKTYKIEKAAIGKYVKVKVTPQTISGKAGAPAQYQVEEAIRDGWDDPTGGSDIELGGGINIFLAGDSTVKDYSDKGMYNSGGVLKEGSWGEFIQYFFDSSKVTIQNYAQGGRSCRTFINEGKLKDIKEKISEGDYLFVQFGHNDCADDYPDRFVPLGSPDASGKYPLTPGTPDANGQYPNGGAGTYKWFLKQYIDVAKEKGAIPVLVTPVARMYYNADGTIKPHHDSKDTKDNAYVTAVKQLAEEEGVLLIDGYEMTKNLFEEAWKAAENDTYGKQIMAEGDKTHNNKLGGMMEAAVFAAELQKRDLSISQFVKAPAQVLGETPDGVEVFSVNGKGEFVANDILTGYKEKASYWEKLGQEMFDAIGKKAGELKPGDDPNNPNDEQEGDTEESKIKVETTEVDKDGKISVRSASIKIEAADLVQSNKVQYVVTVTYTNKAGKQQQLTQDVHYTAALVEGYDGKSAGIQKITISGTDQKTDLGTFIGEKTVSYTIKAKADANRDKAHNIAKKKFRLVKDDVKNAIYTGTYITPEVEDLDGIGESNYSVVYKNNVNVGKASVTIVGKGEYFGTKTLTFSIKKANITKKTMTFEASNATISGTGAQFTATEKNEGDFSYKGNAITLKNLKVKLGEVELSPRADYTVTYAKNAKAGKATATIKGTGNLSGTIKISYDINLVGVVADLKQSNTEDTALEAEYSSKGARLTTIALNGVTLREGKDYKVNYKGCKKPKDGLAIGEVEKVKVTGINSYKSGDFKDVEIWIKTEKGEYHIKDNAVVDTDKTKGDANKIISAAKITDAAGAKVKASDVTITTTNKSIIVTPKSDEYYSETTLACRVAKNLNKVKPTVKTNKIPDRYFDGVNAVTLTETEIVAANVLDGVKATDIRIVSYKNNNKTGTATVTVEGRNGSNYYGKKSLKFKIVAKKATLGSGAKEVTDPAEDPGKDPGTDPGKDPTDVPKAAIWVVGDSTVSGFKDDYYLPRQGYGEQIGTYFNADVYNYAISGRSSKSFTTEKNYEHLMNGGVESINMPKLGDSTAEAKFLIIGFGHNDEKKEDSARYTDPNGDYKTEGSFAKSLYDNYIKPALDAGVTPVVATPIVRYDPKGEYSGSTAHVTADGDYSKAIRDLCATDELKDKVILADLTEATKALYKADNANAAKFHAYTTCKYTNAEKTEVVPEGMDTTHINSYGAKMVVWLLGEQTKDTALNKHWLDKEKPSEAKDYEAAINKNFKPAEYTAPTEEQMKASGWPAFTDASGRQWYSTVFGDVGGDSKITTAGNFVATVDESNKTVTLDVPNGNGKIGGTSDAFFFYYTQLPKDTQFELSAKATINSFDTSSTQVAYGLMARDDIYINKNTKELLGDYVSVGTYKAGAVNCFGRKNGALTDGPAPTKTYVAAGDMAGLKLDKNPDGFTMTYGENDPVSGGFDYPLTKNDSEYIYVGFYVTRKASVTFSDISLVIK